MFLMFLYNVVVVLKVLRYFDIEFLLSFESRTFLQPTVTGLLYSIGPIKMLLFMQMNKLARFLEQHLGAFFFVVNLKQLMKQLFEFKNNANGSAYLYYRFRDLQRTRID